MALLTVLELRQHVETDLSNSAMQRLADAAEEAIDREAGGVADVTGEFNAWGYPRGRHRVLYTARSIGSVTSISERDDPDDTATVLAADDWRQEGNRALVRLRDGTNPRLFWAQHISVVFTPATETATREMVQINLVKMSLVYTAAQRESNGDFDFWHRDQSDEFEAVLRPLRNARNQMPFR